MRITHTHPHTPTHVHTHTCAQNTHIHTHTHTHIHTYTHTHTHTHTYIPSLINAALPIVVPAFIVTLVNQASLTLASPARVHYA